jgi:hypothetical protein
MELKKNDKKLSYILYQEEGSPQFFEVKKSFLKFLFMVLPVTFIFFLATLIFMGVYLKNIKTPNIIHVVEKKPLPPPPRKLVAPKIEPLPEGKKIPALALFKTVENQGDLTGNSKISVTNLTKQEFSEKTQLGFSLENLQSPGTKISGYLFTIVKMENSLIFFPEDAIGIQDFQAEFSKGEKFSFTNLRPFVVTFKKNGKSSGTVRFKIYVFNVRGDLLLEKSLSVN